MDFKTDPARTNASFPDQSTTNGDVDPSQTTFSNRPSTPYSVLLLRAPMHADIVTRHATGNILPAVCTVLFEAKLSHTVQYSDLVDVLLMRFLTAPLPLCRNVYPRCPVRYTPLPALVLPPICLNTLIHVYSAREIIHNP